MGDNEEGSSDDHVSFSLQGKDKDWRATEGWEEWCALNTCVLMVGI